MDGNKGDIRFLLFGLSPLAAHSFNEVAIKGLHAFEGTERELSAIFRGLKIKQSRTFWLHKEPEYWVNLQMKVNEKWRPNESEHVRFDVVHLVSSKR